MISKDLYVCVQLVAILAPWSTALAQIHQLQVRQVDNGGMGDLAHTVTNDLLIDFSGELRGQQITMELTQGSIYQHPRGTNLPPDPSLFPAYPNLSFDTFLTMGGTDAISSEPVLEFVSLEFMNRFESNFIDAAWVPATGAMIADRLDFITARITLTDDAEGSWEYFSTTHSHGRLTIGVIKNGAMIVPEPTTGLIASILVVALRATRPSRGRTIQSLSTTSARKRC